MIDRFLRGPEQHGEMGLGLWFHLFYFILSFYLLLVRDFFFSRGSRIHLFFPLVLYEIRRSASPSVFVPLPPLLLLTGFCRGGLEDFVWWFYLDHFRTTARTSERANERRTDGRKTCSPCQCIKVGFCFCARWVSAFLYLALGFFNPTPFDRKTA